MSSARRKIAILGGGAGALAAAFELSSIPDWESRFEITVYQMGWRLGGKGASGRNREHFNRIEEHGIHLWLGYYENSFGMMRKCYAENGRPLTAPLATWQQAFKPLNYQILEERTPKEPGFPPQEFQALDGDPGDGGIPTHGQTLLLGFKNLASLWNSALVVPRTGGNRPFFERIWHTLTALPQILLLQAGELILGAIAWVLKDFNDDRLRSAGFLRWLLKRLAHFLQRLWRRAEKSLSDDPNALWLWRVFDFGLANLRGYLEDEVINKGFSSLDDIDYRAWLRKHGASENTVNSQTVNWIYKFILHDRTQLSAAVVLHCTARTLLSARGALYWKLQAGMGDVVFAPLYEVLKKRGVRFRFFHRVRNLGLSADGEQVDEIRLGRQATPIHGEYDPLFDVHGLPSWPSEPLYEQLVESDELKARKINLESFWTPWEDVEQVVLKAGKDFDDVVLGISVGGIPATCSEIIARKPAWKAMVENVRTTATQAFQVWTFPDAAGLGFPAWRVRASLMVTRVEPMNSWADMSDILVREEWPDEHCPNHVGYLCGVTDAGVPPADQHDFPRQQLERVRQAAHAYLEKHTRGFWPDAHGPGGFKWELLVDPDGNEGAARLGAQYLRSNIDPSERYVLSVPGSAKFRLDPGGTGVSNLFVAGDWVNTPLNAGCVEAAVIGGMLAARALSGEPIAIEGEAFAYPERAGKVSGRVKP